MGYQRMGPTITLTSHKIQFGCQQAPPPPSYGRQRSDEPVLRHDHCLLQPAQAKSWADTSVEHTPAPPTTSAPTKPNNRGRTTYSDAQIAELEGVFHSNPYPTAQTRQHLACKIDVPEGKVKIWFQNRRARAKKIKMGCGGGNWRTGHNESKTTDEHTNQNNNNMKSDCSKLSSIDSSSISINSLLPLPTKPIIAASKWPGSSCMHPWRAPYHPEASHSCRMHSHPQPYCSGHSGCSCAPTGPRNVKMWNWGSGNYMPQPCHSMYKPELDDYRNPAHNSWDSHCAFGNAPDIVTKTSKVRLNDSSISNGEENTSNTSKHENPHDTSASETEQMNTSERFSESAKIINPYDAETCSIAPTYNSTFLSGNNAARETTSNGRTIQPTTNSKTNFSIPYSY
uniref:homeobox protein aristaless-like 3 n=1 Tax=Styela clava TaxID=7725 RepID=UPI0019394788|nr:homeobox protein aristaless-like 3 [Styela clava]